MEITNGYKINTTISLDESRKLASELEILAMKEIPHNERIKDLIENPGIAERRILVGHADNFESPFIYRITDYAVEDGKMVSLGHAEYTSQGLRENSDYHQWLDPRPAV